MKLHADTATENGELEWSALTFDRYVDPLDADSSTDTPIIVTRRQLMRLALVSTEAGARFQREAIDHDSMAWMLAPRHLFGGVDALEATLERHHCVRALLLHGLALGMDAAPEDIDGLLDEQACDSGGLVSVVSSATCDRPPNDLTATH